MIQVELTHTYNFVTTLDLPDGASDAEIKAAIEKLENDDFRDLDNYQNVAVIRIGEGWSKDITGDIQPHTPKLNPL